GDAAAYDVAAARHCLFTEHLLAGLRGAAGGRDGFVRILDLYHHIQRCVVARAPSQRPILGIELEDNYPIARFPHDARAALTAVAPPTSFAYDLLIVHASDGRDRAWARSLIRLLDDRGIRVCSEERDADLTGDSVIDLDRLVSTSRYTMPILTPRFSAGRFRHLQAVMTDRLGIEDGIARLIPIVREPCEARLGLRSLVHLDMIRDENVVPGIERLARTLRKAAAAPSPAVR
ncbi:MAG TPA: toll/interleukin-1 receptor domain-containing protein, partial [Kofleriaceae bacterium]